MTYNSCNVMYGNNMYHVALQAANVTSAMHTGLESLSLLWPQESAHQAGGCSCQPQCSCDGCPI